ncbi:DAGLA family protein [Megaselia abdita]
MPGLVVFRRRWSVGSDDLIVPAAFLLILHFIWLLIISVSILAFEYDMNQTSIFLMYYYEVTYNIILVVSFLIELSICLISMRGSILDASTRTTINYWIYAKSVVISFDISWLILGLIWIKTYYFKISAMIIKEIVLAMIVCGWILVAVTITTVWCTFDAAGRSWVKMKKYQRSMRDSESRFNYKRSGSMNRNWRQRKVIRAYQDSWDHRCRLLFCCMGSSERNRNSFTDIARLLSDFFRELDVVPSDVIAGLVLLRKFQKLEREAIMRQKKNGTYEFLSGVPITNDTQFLALNDVHEYDFFQTVVHYMHFAQGAYGWPIYFMGNRSGIFHLISEMRCVMPCFCRCRSIESAEIIQDNCCLCNYAALKKTLQVSDVEIIYVTYHVDVGETPFFVAIDYSKRKIVISIRGTLSMKDVLTDLNAESEVLPLTAPKDDWLGHKGMVQAAIYIKNKLEELRLIEKALAHDTTRKTETFGLVLVGHSLGAGTASILAILMKPEYPSLICFSYSPPGGLLSMPAVEYSKSFITSVVLGKDVVPRIGLHQMETLRADLINAIKRSVDPKWKTISCSVICCCCGPEPTSVVEMSSKDVHINQYKEQKKTARTTSTHPTDSSIALTLHQPLYPPGRIIHIVRHHPKPDVQEYGKSWRNVLKPREPVYQAIWADSTDFDEVLISPVMLQDHMPDKVLAALKKVVSCSGPRKPQRHSTSSFNYSNLPVNNDNYLVTQPNSMYTIDFQNTLLGNNCLEVGNRSTSSKTSSITGSILKNNQAFDIHSLSMSEVVRSHSVPSDATTVIFADGFTNNCIEKTSISIQCLNNDLLPEYMLSSTRKMNDKNDYEAPLASPETLSEISSISSKDSINILRNGVLDFDCFIDSNPNIFESQLHTPKVMRRALKFTENLSTCANNKRNLDQYKRLGRVFKVNPLQIMQSSDNQSISSNDSYENNSIQLIPFENSKSADHIDNDIDTQVLDKKLTFSDSTSINGCLSNNIKQCPSNMDSKRKLSSNETFYSAQSSKSSIDKLLTIKNKTIEYTVQYQESGLLESHFPVYNSSEKSQDNEETNGFKQNPNNKKSYCNVNKKTSPNTINSSKINKNDNKTFLLNESLPLLSNLSERNRPTQKFSKRKGCVYPEGVLGNNSNIITLSKSESNV